MLVCEDDGDVAKVVSEVLDGAGFVTITTMPDDTREAVRLYRPSVLVVDPVPYDQRYRDLAATLRHDDATPPIVVLAGTQERERSMRELDATAAVDKPFDIDDLIRACLAAAA